MPEAESLGFAMYRLTPGGGLESADAGHNRRVAQTNCVGKLDCDLIQADGSHIVTAAPITLTPVFPTVTVIGLAVGPGGDDLPRGSRWLCGSQPP